MKRALTVLAVLRDSVHEELGAGFTGKIEHWFNVPAGLKIITKNDYREAARK